MLWWIVQICGERVLLFLRVAFAVVFVAVLLLGCEAQSRHENV
jgi:hypothetical protein